MRYRLLLLSVATLAWSPAAPLPAQAQAAAAAMAPDTSWVGRSTIYQVFVRDFSQTGDLRGVIAGLDRIEAAGASVVWLMPIHPVGVTGRKGTLGSPYSVRDYYAIDVAFGTGADFRALVQAVHQRGMRLILGWVPNHTAPDAAWTREHPDFYVRDGSGRLTVPRDEKGNLTDWTDVAQLDYANPAMRQAMIAAMRHWLVEYDIDGFRMDVAGFVPDGFWREATAALRGAVSKPILLLAEWGDPRMHRLGFDLIYAWDSYSRLKEVWRGAPAAEYVRREIADLEALRPGGGKLRFTTNHDETAWDNPPVALFGGPAGARAAFTATALMPGRPMLYNGQEIEHPVKLRLFERDPIDWGQPDAEPARVFYRRVMDLARNRPEFRTGDVRVLETSAPEDIIAYRRGATLVVVNTRPREIRLTVAGTSLAGLTDLLTGRQVEAGPLVLPGYGALVLSREP